MLKLLNSDPSNQILIQCMWSNGTLSPLLYLHHNKKKYTLNIKRLKQVLNDHIICNKVKLYSSI